MRQIARSLLCLSLLAPLSLAPIACDDPVDAPAEPVALEVVPAGDTLNIIGEVVQFLAVVSFDDGSSRTAPEVAWTGDAPTVFSVPDAEIGRVEAVGEGSGTLTATLAEPGKTPLTATASVVVEFGPTRPRPGG